MYSVCCSPNTVASRAAVTRWYKISSPYQINSLKYIHVLSDAARPDPMSPEFILLPSNVFCRAWSTLWNSSAVNGGSPHLVTECSGFPHYNALQSASSYYRGIVHKCLVGASYRHLILFGDFMPTVIRHDRDDIQSQSSAIRDTQPFLRARLIAIRN